MIELSPSSDGEKDRFKFEFSIPIAQIRRFMTSLEEIKEDKIWFDGEFDKRRIQVISVDIGEKSLQIIEEWLQKCEENE